jgi:hypothetical protein
MARTKGSTDSRPRQRRQETQEEKEKKAKEKQGRLQRESQKAKASFFSALTAPAPEAESEDDSSVVNEDLSTAENPSEESIEEISGMVWRGVVDTQGIVADLDEEDYDDEDADTEEFETNDIHTDDDGVMSNYLSAIQLRIRRETADKNLNSSQQWLLQEIKDNGHWMRKERAKLICRKLAIPFDEPSCCRDVRIWFPEIEGGIACTPKCPSCSSNALSKNFDCTPTSSSKTAKQQINETRTHAVLISGSHLSSPSHIFQRRDTNFR